MCAHLGGLPEGSPADLQASSQPRGGIPLTGAVRPLQTPAELLVPLSALSCVACPPGRCPSRPPQGFQTTGRGRALASQPGAVGVLGKASPSLRGRSLGPREQSPRRSLPSALIGARGGPCLHRFSWDQVVRLAGAECTARDLAPSPDSGCQGAEAPLFSGTFCARVLRGVSA